MNIHRPALLVATLLALWAPARVAAQGLASIAGLPSDQAFADPDVTRILSPLTGRRTGEILQLMEHSKPLFVHGDRYLVGEGCIPDLCDAVGAMFVIDIESEDALVVVAPDGRSRSRPFDILVTDRAFDLPQSLDDWVTAWKEGKPRLPYE